MIAKYFVDSNIFIYARDSFDTTKQKVATEILRARWKNRCGHISFQVLSEIFVVLTGKYHVSDEDAFHDLENLRSWNPVPIGENVISTGILLRRHYKLSWWDCLIVASALVQDCKYLLSEDMADGVTYHSVQVRNPFSTGFQMEAILKV